MEQTEILVKSSMDGTDQPSLFFSAKEKGRPLLVGLHTWSHDRFNQITNMLPLAQKHDFNLLLPEFRGANLKGNPNHKKACGSDYVINDIKDAIDYCIENLGVDKNNVFLLGASGGGQVALLTASRFPELFVAVGAFVPVCDLVAWQNEWYREQVLACCGSEEEMVRRSPISYIDGIAKTNVKIFHGKYDPVVPRSQSIDLYNKLSEKYPEARVFLDIFDGGHQMDITLAERWILSQYEKSGTVTVTG